MPGYIKMMIARQPRPQTTHQESVSIRALSSITPSQAEFITQAVNASAPAWTVQTTDDYDGYCSILIEPAGSHDELSAFFIAGTAQHLELFETHGDDMILLARFTDAADLSARLLGLIARQ